MNPELAAIFRKVMFEPEWRRAQRTGIYFHDFVAYVNGRFAKLHPGHDASRPALGTNDPHA